MKEYKYKINGNTYNVSIGDIVDNMTEVLVNGTPYKVELEKQKSPVTVVAPNRPSAAPRTATGEKVVAKAGHKWRLLCSQSSPPWHYPLNQCQGRRHRKGCRHCNRA